MDKAHTVEVLGHLVELERDRLLALDAAIDRVEDREARARLKDFRAEHEADLGELEDSMKALMAPPPDLATLGGLEAEARVNAAALAGDDVILANVARSERHAQEAYAVAAADEGLGESLRHKLETKVDGERSHGEWLARWLDQHA